MFFVCVLTPFICFLFVVSVSVFPPLTPCLTEYEQKTKVCPSIHPFMHQNYDAVSVVWLVVCMSFIVLCLCSPLMSLLLSFLPSFIHSALCVVYLVQNRRQSISYDAYQKSHPRASMLSLSSTSSPFSPAKRNKKQAPTDLPVMFHSKVRSSGYGSTAPVMRLGVMVCACHSCIVIWFGLMIAALE